MQTISYNLRKICFGKEKCSFPYSLMHFAFPKKKM
jgi:hypothetical protein